MQICQIKYFHPLEREYEAWIMHQIEKYFDSLKIPCTIFAASPKIEKKWPADESLLVNIKLIGFQFKRTMIKDNS